jgi:von Willebrand factor type A domain
MKGILFTMDALFALLLVAATIPFILFLASSRPDPIGQIINTQADSAIDAIALIKIKNVIREPVISDLYAQDFLTENDINKSVMEVIAELWASNTTENLTRVQNITQNLFSSVLPENMNWALSLENDTVFDTGGSMKKAYATGRRVASGFLKGANSSGYQASIFLTSIGGRKAFSYYFFGGFVGQGNITVFIKDIPSNATIKEIYMELSIGSNFTFFVNGHPCGTYNKTTDPVNITINDSCIGYVTPGTDNMFNFIFVNPNIVTHYIGGGMLRIAYTTNELIPTQQNVTIIDIPGIDGIINYFGSFFVNGNITSMKLKMHIRNNYSTFVNIGNVTIFNTTGNESDETYIINNATLAAKLNYSFLGHKTVPMRIGVGILNITAGDGTADVVLITDISGSMDWNFTCTSTSSCSDGTRRDNCSDPNLFNLNTRRISVAKCLDKEFINIILNNTGNRIGLVAFSSDADDYINLTANTTTLTNKINSYNATVSTCVACAINRAYQMLQSQSSTNRKKFIVTMTDGVANVRALNTCNDLRGAGSFTGEVFAGGANGEVFKRNDTGNWNNMQSATTNQINDIDMLNATFGFSVGSSGTIMKWNGSTWATITSPIVSTINGLDIYNRTFALAVGSSGRVIRWNGSTWATAATISNSPTLYAVSIFNWSLVFASGSRSNSGKIYKSANGGATWTEDNDSGQNYYGVNIINSSVAYAVGSNGNIIKWNRTMWRPATSPTNDDLYRVESYNSTYALAVGGDSGNSVIIKYNGTGWSTTYDASGDSLRDIVIYDNISYAIGDGATIIENNGSWARTFNISRAYSGNSTSGTSCTADQDTCQEPNSFPGLNANYSSCRAHVNLNSTVHSIGFGPVASCSYASKILQSIAKCGNGTYYSSNDTEGLKDIYKGLAEDIVTQAFENQTTIVSDNVTSRLYTDSYLEMNYTQEVTSAYQEIVTDIETSKFDNCNYTFFVPAQLRLDETKVTSFSGSLWTSNVSINSSKTGNKWNNTYLITSYGTNFQALGDPFIVNIPTSLVQTGGNNSVIVHLGVSAANVSIACPSNSTVLYRAYFRASVPYGGVFSALKGGIARVYYDIDHDGLSDGFTDITYGSNLTDFDPTIRNMDELDATENALDDAVIRLMNTLNFVVKAGNSGISGSQTNPIDIKLSDVNIDVTFVGDVPFEWGPIDIRLDVNV